MPSETVLQRNMLIRWLQYEALENFVGLGFGAMKSGLAR
jgi:hypothetical protein